jgi:hypothetical protein
LLGAKLHAAFTRILAVFPYFFRANYHLALLCGADWLKAEEILGQCVSETQKKLWNVWKIEFQMNQVLACELTDR